MHTLIHLPQQWPTVGKKVALVTVENVLVPALLLGIFALLRQPLWGIGAIIVWRALFLGSRWHWHRWVPLTSLLTFAVLAVRSLTAVSINMTVLHEQAVAAYIVPAALMSVLLGLYFCWQSFSAHPITLKLVQDFLTIPTTAHSMLWPAAKNAGVGLGLVYVLSGTAGLLAALYYEASTAALAASILALVTPVVAVLVIGFTSWHMARKMAWRISFAQHLPAA